MIKIDMTVREALNMVSNGCGVDMFDRIVAALENAMPKEKCNVTITGGMSTDNRIPCIKAIRKYIGCGLKEAKDLTDKMVGYYDAYGVWHKGDLKQIQMSVKTNDDAILLLRSLENAGCQGYLS